MRGSKSRARLGAAPARKAVRFFPVAAASACVLALVFATPTPCEATTYDVLHSFSGSPGEGSNPYARLLLAADGNFYGTTEAGGASGVGTAFKMDASGTLTTLHSFAYSDGAFPYAGLIQATDGNFYGTTQQGGAIGWGTVFKMDASGNLTTLHSFAFYNDGAYPYSSPSLIQATDGNFYGTTEAGGASGVGTAFKMDASGNLTTLHSFANSDGANPFAGLIQATDGNFYGTTLYGGASGYGTVFQMDPSGNLTTLHSFTGSDGAYPYAGLIQATDGNFYGTTQQGGASGIGTAFKMDASGTLTTLHSFAYSDGALPYAGLIQATDGNFYGTTYRSGASGYGTVFQMDPSGNLTTLHSFTGSDGAYAYAGLIQATDGNFYGTTQQGGASGFGVVFRLTTCDSPTAAVSGSASICPGSSTTIQVALTGSAPWSVTWSDGVTQTGVSSSPAARSVSPSSTTTYTVTAMSDAECAGTATGSATVTVNPLPAATISAGGPTTFCQGGSVALAAAPSGGSGSFSSYQWYRNGAAVGGATAVGYSAALSGMYTATVKDSAGCTSPASNAIPVTVIPLPTATISGTAAICKGASTTIQASLTGTGPWNLTWSDGLKQTGIAASPTTRIVAPTATTTYTVTAISDANCTGTTSGSAVVTVEFPPKAAVTGSATICAGSSVQIQANLTGTAPWNLVWSDGFAQTVSASPATRTVSPTSTTTYSVTTLSDAACAGSGSGGATVKVKPVPSSAVTAPASVCANSSGNSASVPNAGGGATYSWSLSNGTIISGLGSRSIKFHAGLAGSVTITITVTRANGCTSTSTITIPINC
jgi:uncharacterized repeat protein (TIGR03803 family)